jgi:maltodextrin utilization protein YvdJ
MTKIICACGLFLGKKELRLTKIPSDPKFVTNYAISQNINEIRNETLRFLISKHWFKTRQRIQLYYVMMHRNTINIVKYMHAAILFHFCYYLLEYNSLSSTDRALFEFAISLSY